MRLQSGHSLLLSDRGPTQSSTKILGLFYLLNPVLPRHRPAVVLVTVVALVAIGLNSMNVLVTISLINALTKSRLLIA